jgi:hypothetical protein
MDLGAFLAAIGASGRVRVGREEPAPGAVDRVLEELDRAVRADGPADLPGFDPAAARWGAAMLQRGCALFAHRDLGPEAVAAFAAAPWPSPAAAPSTHYSADLALRHLPELFDLGRGLAPGDPLLEALTRLGRELPLCSVGIAGLGEGDPGALSALCASRGLLSLYVDRILRCDDASRLADPRVAAAVAQALGDQLRLAPPCVAAAMKEIRNGR